MTLYVCCTTGRKQFHFNGGHYTAKSKWDWVRRMEPLCPVEIEKEQVCDLMLELMRLFKCDVIFGKWDVSREKAVEYLEIYNDYRE